MKSWGKAGDRLMRVGTIYLDKDTPVTFVMFGDDDLSRAKEDYDEAGVEYEDLIDASATEVERLRSGSTVVRVRG